MIFNMLNLDCSFLAFVQKKKHSELHNQWPDNTLCDGPRHRIAADDETLDNMQAEFLNSMVEYV